jgi:hypothetical protein
VRIRHTLALLTAVAGLAAILTPALASGAAPSNHPTQSSSGTTGSQPGPSASLPAKAKAYGRYCQAESKTHVAGTPGTPFSTCVTDMAKLAKGKAANPHKVCLNESKTHVAHTKGTPYSQCVAGGERLLKAQAKT